MSILGYEIEVDESYFGARRRGTLGKISVVELLKRQEKEYTRKK